MKLLRSVPAGRFARRLGAYLVDRPILFGGVLMPRGLILAAGLNPVVARAAVTLLPFEWTHLVVFNLFQQTGAQTPLARAGIGLTWALVLGLALSTIVAVAQRSKADWAFASRVPDR